MHPSEMLLKKHVKNTMTPLFHAGAWWNHASTTPYDFAKKIITNYFSLTLNLHAETMRTGTKTLIELHHATFGVLYIPPTASTHMADLIASFNLLIQQPQDDEQIALKKSFLEAINAHWNETNFAYFRKLANLSSSSGDTLSAFELEQILQHQANAANSTRFD